MASFFFFTAFMIAWKKHRTCKGTTFVKGPTKFSICTFVQAKQASSFLFFE